MPGAAAAIAPEAYARHVNQLDVLRDALQGLFKHHRVTAMMFRLQYAKIPDTDIQRYEFWISVKVRTRMSRTAPDFG